MIRFLALMGALCSISLFFPARAANAALDNEVRTLFANGGWDRALALLEKAPDAKTDPALRGLLAMAYLYSSSRIDNRGNLAKAEEQMKLIVSSGGELRFLVSLSRDEKREKHLVESTPGELVITTGSVEFQPHPETKAPVKKWEKATLTECAANPKYGTSSHSFHLNATIGKDKTETFFRPWHNSTEEIGLICSFIGIQPVSSNSSKKK